jgi:23S rRNA pseudouridine1911/1915/1917 synthase
VVTVELPPAEFLEIVPQEVDFRVLHEDEDCIVLHKPSGVVVHPAPGNWEGTLVHGLLYRYPDIGEINGQKRPGIVHRLDQGTSGLMVVARNMWAHDRLSRAFRERRVWKEYLALALGRIPWAEHLVDLPIGRHPYHRTRMAVVREGRPAQTDFYVLRNYARTTLLRCVLHTGRTHQIRVHAAYLGHPLWGDTLYGYGHGAPSEERIFLHAWKLAFEHPRTGKVISFRDPLDQELVRILRQQP